ncbi:histidine kinase, partial [Schaalia naturae]|uniref:histidine kinase n=1 Tax=Schaalia naturae TaxID=635203 RepID=UPI003636073D
ASEARAAVHRGLARELHDTAVRDLARIIMASQSIAQRSADPGVAQEAERLTELAAHAMRSIRSLMTGDEEAAAEEAPGGGGGGGGGGG